MHSIFLRGAFALVPVVAFGQDPAPVKTMSTVIVEAEREAPTKAEGAKTGIELIETPQAISVVTAEVIQEQNIKRLGDALRGVAGVSASSTYGYYDAYTLRGYDAAYGSVFLDGLTTSSAAGTNNELAGLEQVEVIKGPAAALYGASPLGGIVNLVSKRPKEDTFVETNLATGSYNLVEAHVDANAALSERLLTRINLLVREADDFIDHAGSNRVFVAPAVTWLISEDTKFTFLGRYQRDRDNPWAPVTAYGTVLPSVHGDLPIDFSVNRDGADRAIANQERTSVGYQFEHRFSDAISLEQTLRNTYSKTYWNNWVFSDDFVDNGFIDGVQQGELLGLLVYGPFRQTDKDIGVDTRAKFEFDTGAFTHQLAVGVDYKRNHNVFADGGGNFTLDQNVLPILNPTNTQPLLHDPAQAYGGEGKTHQTGTYFQEHLGLPGEKWFVTLGGRWDDVDTDGQKDSAFSHNVGVNYLLRTDLALYANAARPFTPNAGWRLDIDGNQLPPETGSNFEVGIKWGGGGTKTFGLVSIFQLTRQNVATEDPQNPFFYVVTGEQRSRGLEIEGGWDPTPAWEARWAYTYLDAEITRDNTLIVGTTLSNAPKHNLFLSGRYRVQSGALAGLSFGVSGLYNSERNSSLWTWDIDGDGIEEPAVPLPSYMLIDAGMRYERGDWDARLTLSNVLDERYFPDAGFTTRVTPGEPRNWTLGLTRKF